MTTLTRSPEPDLDRPAPVRRRSPKLHVGLVVAAIGVVGLGAVVLVNQADGDDPPSVPPAIDEVVEEFVLAMEHSDLERLQSVVTPGFRRTFYQGDADGSPWRDVWRLERYEVWDNPNVWSVVWEIERGDDPIFLGSGPWYVSESQTWRNAAGGIQYEGVATFVVIETGGAVVIDDMYWAARPRPLQLDSIEHVDRETRAEFVDWMVARFISTGLDPPDAMVIWLPPSLDCPLGDSHAQRSDSARRHSVTLCFDDPGLLLDGNVDGRWSRTATRFGLHEFAHVWMYIHLGDETRAAFVERAGLEVWRGDRAWGELGVEHAAETIAWGVAGSDAARYDIEPEPTCAELTQRFELLTGVPPFTSCATWNE